MQLTKMATGITPAKRKKIVPLSSVLDMLEDSPSKRQRLTESETRKTSPVKSKTTPARRKLSDSSDDDSPKFQTRSFYNPARIQYLSPIQRKSDRSPDSPIVGGFATVLENRNISLSAGPKLQSQNISKMPLASSHRPFSTRKKRVGTFKKRIPLKETRRNSVNRNSLNVEDAVKVARQPVKNELTFKLNVKPFSPIHTPTNSASGSEQDIEEPLTWDVEKLTPASKEKKFFKHRPSPGESERSRMEKGTSLVVKQGFKMKFLHHRGENSKSASCGKNKQSFPARTTTPVIRKNLIPKSPNSASTTEDAMMKKLKEELMNQADPGNTFTFFSSDESVNGTLCKEEVGKITKESKSGTCVENKVNSITISDDLTPELFSQSSDTPALVHVSHSEQVMGSLVAERPADHCPSVSADTTSQSNQPHSAENVRESNSGRSSPLGSIASESNSSPLSSDLDSISSGYTVRTPRSARRAQSDQTANSGQKYFPIFTRNSTPKRTALTKIFKSVDSPKGSALRKTPRSPVVCKDGMEQMIIDAGQSNIGAKQCDVCGMVYTPGESADDAMHAKFHQHLVAALKFPGWKKERVLQEHPEDGGRILLVLPDDPKYATKKVEDINKIMAQELGFPETAVSFQSNYKVFVYVSDEKKIVGCCVAEPVSQGFRVIPDPRPSGGDLSQRPWCCETTPSPAAVGISRIWVMRQNRRQGIATKLLEAVRHWFEYGVVIDKDMVAFSDPTPNGKQLGASYTGKNTFLVYKYNGN